MLHCQLLYQTRSSVGTNCFGTLFRLGRFRAQKGTCLPLSSIKVDCDRDTIYFFWFRCPSDVREQPSRLLIRLLLESCQFRLHESNGMSDNHCFLDNGPCYHTLGNATCIPLCRLACFLDSCSCMVRVKSCIVSLPCTSAKMTFGSREIRVKLARLLVQDQDQDQDRD